MAVVVTMDVKGDTQDLIRRYDIVDKELASRPGGPPEGLIAHFWLETPDGIRVSNLWDSDEHAQADVENPTLREALAKAEMPATTPQFLAVHHHFIVSEMRSAD